MARMNSPHLIGLRAAYEDDRSLYLVMELARGGDLYAMIMRNRRRLNEDQASHIIKQVLLGLSDLHKALVIHRDV